MRNHVYPSTERRHGEPAIPNDLDSLLTPAQRHTLEQAESFGWRLAYVRHPLFQTPMVIIARDDDGAFASINEAGELEFSPGLVLRH